MYENEEGRIYCREKTESDRAEICEAIPSNHGDDSCLFLLVCALFPSIHGIGAYSHSARSFHPLWEDMRNPTAFKPRSDKA